MLSNYLKIAWRNIIGSPMFSAINVIGLAIGLACCIIITVFVNHEVSYDKQWQNSDRIYRVTRDFFSNNLRLAAVAPNVAPLLMEDFSEVEDATREEELPQALVERYGVRAYLGIPVRIDQSVVGTLCVLDVEKRGFAPDSVLIACIAAVHQDVAGLKER